MTQPQAITTPAADLNLMERVLVGGDLSRLTAPERLEYYQRVCDSLGLNPLTRPFEYITLNGKLVLYAGRNCTDQLRSTRNVSVTITARERLEDLYVVTARATTPEGRTDESVGAVVLTNLKGEALANAIMRAETKAKRRVTLSICGLSWADESEVSSIPNAQPANVDMETGEISLAEAPMPAYEQHASPNRTILQERAAAAIAARQPTPARASAEQVAMLKSHRERLGWTPDQLVDAVGNPNRMTNDEAAVAINALAELPTPEPPGNSQEMPQA